MLAHQVDICLLEIQSQRGEKINKPWRTFSCSSSTSITGEPVSSTTMGS